MELIQGVLNGDLQSRTCLFCLCELSDECDYVGLGDCVLTPAQEVSVAMMIDTVYSSPKIKGLLSSVLPNKLCLKCFRKVYQAYHLEESYEPDIKPLEHYVTELYEKLADIPALADDADSIFIYVNRLEPKNFVSRVKCKQPDKLKCNNHIEKGSRSNDKLYLVMEDNEKSSVFKITADMKNIEDISTKEEINILTKFRRSLRKKAQCLHCKHCNKSYYSAKWLAHHTMKIHGIIMCEECDVKFESTDQLRAHVESHPVAYTCDLCGQGFKFRHSIVEHLMGHKKSGSSRCVCETCGARLADEAALARHTAARHGPCAGGGGVAHTCYYCGRGYRGAASFETHVRKHESLQRTQYECGVCGATYAARAQLARHTLAAHRAHQPHASACGDTSRTPAAHRRLHDAARQHRCETCQQGFVDKRALTWHRRLHTGERPYACADCGRRFVSRNRRNQHALTKHTAPARQCPFCPALFHLRSMVNTHIKKVHLREHKRRARPPRHVDVRWPIQKVPFEELSVHVQTELLERSVGCDEPPEDYSVMPNATGGTLETFPLLQDRPLGKLHVMPNAPGGTLDMFPEMQDRPLRKLHVMSNTPGEMPVSHRASLAMLPLLQIKPLGNPPMMVNSAVKDTALSRLPELQNRELTVMPNASSKDMALAKLPVPDALQVNRSLPTKYVIVHQRTFAE